MQSPVKIERQLWRRILTRGTPFDKPAGNSFGSA
jgi:hypothetical protein